ncbi:MFS transporter [Apilactobacillus apinorum]|uniref:MFS transporter n=1 Tax=Apilactobacillus apinorum TaxID=1218495 RepID=UPI0006B65A8D|nr:MFS transporter [Apilactobacillus apinorum]KOY68351.1 MFS family major facilitator transporter [Apilactobacillus apinorum]CAI2690686.1 MFS family major facilitator transporter [Apilactobacillus apinorum]
MDNNSYWKKNLWILLFGTFLTGIAFSEVIPFQPLYISELGNFSKSELALWSGVVYASSFVVVIFTSAMWGRFADRHGRKRMVLQTSFGSAVTLFLMAFCTNVWELLILKCLQGFFDGVIPNSIALVATSTPREKTGYALSWLSTGYTSGFLVGPIFGGFLVHILNIRVSFMVTGLLLFSFFLLTYFFVEEHFVPDPSKVKAKKESFIKIIKGFPNTKFIVWILIISVSLQIMNNSINPLITLYVKELMGNSGNVSVVSGLVAAMPGIGMVLVSPWFGRFGDKYGTNKVLTLGFIMAILFIFPQGFAPTVLFFGVFRFLTGVSNAAIFPSVQTLLAKETPSESTGMAFSLNQGAQAVGICIGSLMGSIISSIWDYDVVFYVSAFVVLMTFIIVKIKTDII